LRGLLALSACPQGNQCADRLTKPEESRLGREYALVPLGTSLTQGQGYREGDALVVTKLDRLARSVAHLVAIGERLDAKEISLNAFGLMAISYRDPALMKNFRAKIAFPKIGVA